MSSFLQPFRRGLDSFRKSVSSFSNVSEAATSAVEGLTAKIADGVGVLLAFCFASAIQIAVVSVQIQGQLPPIFHLLSLSILLGFTSLLVAKFVKFKSLKPYHLLHWLGLFLLVFAFFIAISIPFPLYFKIISYIVFLTASSLIFYCAFINSI